MTTERALKLLKIERECVSRGSYCDRDCNKCDLVQKTDELIEMYDYVIEYMK